MKRTFLFSMMMAIAMTFSFNANAQGEKKDGKRNFNREQVVQMRAQKIANKLELDDATTAKFIETYKAYLKETHEVFQKYGKAMMGKKGEEKARKSDAEVEQEIKNQFTMSRALVDVREKYYNKFRAFLNPRQIKVVYSQERDNANRMKFEKDRRDKDGKGPRKGGPRGPQDGMHKHHNADMKQCKDNDCKADMKQCKDNDCKGDKKQCKDNDCKK